MGIYDAIERALELGIPIAQAMATFWGIEETQEAQDEFKEATRGQIENVRGLAGDTTGAGYAGQWTQDPETGEWAQLPGGDGLYPRIMGGQALAGMDYLGGLDREMMAAQGMYGQFDPETGQFMPGQMYGAFQDYSGDLMGRYGQRQTGLMNLQSVLGGNLMGLQARQGTNLMDMQQEGMGGLLGAYGQTRGEMGGMIGGQNQGLNLQYGQRLSTVMGMLDELGGQERRDIESSWDDQSSQAQMDLASRGLSNTTVLSTMEAGYEERKRDDLGRLDERLRREKTTAYEGLSADMLMSQERGYLRNLEMEMGLRTGELGAMERGYGQQLGLAGGLADQRLGLSQGISNQQLGMLGQLSGEQLGMYGQLGQQGLGYLEQGMGGMMGAMEQDRLARYGLMQDTMGYDIGLTQNMMNFEAGIQHMPPSMYPWQVAQQGIQGIGNYWGSMRQAQAYGDAQQQQPSGWENLANQFAPYVPAMVYAGFGGGA